MRVKVSFDFEPENPDDDDSTGMEVAEYETLTEGLMELGATNIQISKGDD